MPEQAEMMSSSTGRRAGRRLPRALAPIVRLSLSRRGVAVWATVGALIVLAIVRTLVDEHAGLTRWALLAACAVWLGLAPVLAALARRRR